MKLSYNSASTFRSCRKKYYWRYVQKIIPVTKHTNLSLGGIIHEGFEKFYLGAGDRDVYKLISERFDEEIGKEEVADQEDLLIGKYTALGMWLNYPYKNLQEFEAIQPEESFEVPLCEGVTFCGRVDGRLQQHGNCWVRELKTTGLSKRQFESRARVSGQATGYVYGLKKLNHDVKGILYEYIKKPTLRKGVNETADSFGRRIMQDYRTRPSLYYHRHLSYRTVQDLNNFESDMCSLANDIQRTTEFYRNVDQCWNYNAECEYAKICFSEEPDPLTLELYYTRRNDDVANLIP